MREGVELKGNIQEVVPMRGSVTYVRFDTDQRRQFMLPARAVNGRPLPFGTEILTMLAPASDMSPREECCT